MAVIGVDEVGRGAWAGPLLICALEIDDGLVSGLNDSKKLTKLQREKLYDEIQVTARQIGFGSVSATEIDKYGLAKSMWLGVKRALSGIDCKQRRVIFDGNINYWPENPRAEAIVRADGKIESVSAASIIAKVTRDRKMSQLGLELPGYGFENHVGYGTAEHHKALKKLGITNAHRKSFAPVTKLL